MSLHVDGPTIRQHSIDGPYEVRSATLFNDQTTVDFQDTVLNTQAYSYTQFELPALLSSGTYSNQGVDTDGDGLFDALEINIGATVSVSDTYYIEGLVTDPISGTLPWIGQSILLNTGFQTATLSIDAGSIVRHTTGGPYHLDLLRILDSSGQLVLKQPDPYTTTGYNLGKFASCAGVGDVNRNTQVETGDLQILANLWRSATTDPQYDLDDDGLITVGDIEFAARDWGRKCP